MSTTKLLINQILDSYYKLINNDCLFEELELVCDDDNYNLYELTHTNRLINEDHENLLNNFGILLSMFDDEYSMYDLEYSIFDTLLEIKHNIQEFDNRFL